jgi:hypothetical protein
MGNKAAVLVGAFALVFAGACAAEVTSISEAEKVDLAFVREEEKLARDVYDEVASIGGPSFDNVSSSEQTHMDKVKGLLDTYGISDPASGKAAGELQNDALRGLYGALVAKGKSTRVGALEVGCEIEELDLHDLQGVRDRSTKDDVRLVLDELMRGSRNHLRAFYGQLRSDGGAYVPKHVDQATFDGIVASAQEKGNGR